MIAKKCDRCGALYEQYNLKNNPMNINGIMFLNLDGSQQYFGHKPSDLCPKCSDELLNWWYQDDDQS